MLEVARYLQVDAKISIAAAGARVSSDPSRAGLNFQVVAVNVVTDIGHIFLLVDFAARVIRRKASSYFPLLRNEEISRLDVKSPILCCPGRLVVAIAEVEFALC